MSKSLQAASEVQEVLENLHAKNAAEYFPDEDRATFSRLGIESIVEEAFLAGSCAMADSIQARRGATSSVTYPRALEMLAEGDTSDEWVCDAARLEHHEGVRLIAWLYGVPVLRVASDLSEIRRHQIREYLAERGLG